MTDLNKELERAVELAKLLNKEVGNSDHMMLQAKLLNEEGLIELGEGIFEDDRTKLRDALADTVVIGMGGFYIGAIGFVSLVDTDVSANSYVSDIFGSSTVAYDSAVHKNIDDAGYDMMRVVRHVIGFAKRVGVNLASDLKAVNDSNLSKFCLTEGEAILTATAYSVNYDLKSEIKETGNPDYPYAVYSLEEKENFKIGKLLKSINYKSPQFETES